MTIIAKLVIKTKIIKINKKATAVANGFAITINCNGALIIKMLSTKILIN